MQLLDVGVTKNQELTFCCGGPWDVSLQAKASLEAFILGPVQDTCVMHVGLDFVLEVEKTEDFVGFY